MKKWIIRAIIGIVALAVVAMVIAFLSINIIVKKGVNNFGPKITKVDTRLGGANISVFSGRGELTDFLLGNPEGFKTPSAIKVGNVTVAVKPSSLMSDVIQVNEVNVQAPEITLEAGLSGSNLGKILDQLKGAPATPSSEPAQKSDKPSKNIYIKDLVINGGKVNMSVTALGGKAVTVPLPPIHLTEIGSPEKGVTMAEASQKIMQEVVSQVTKVAGQGANAVGSALKDTGSNAVEQAGKAVEGIKSLFKK